MATDALDLRAPEEGDLAAVAALFERIPEGERHFLKDDAASDPAQLGNWLEDRRCHRLLAVAPDGSVLGYASIRPGVGWSSHVGELALVVDPVARRRGVGRALARRAVRLALELELTKIVVEVVAEQSSAIAMFETLGFEAEALLRDHIRDHGGRLRDLIVLAHPVGDTWAILRTTGIEDELS